MGRGSKTAEISGGVQKDIDDLFFEEAMRLSPAGKFKGVGSSTTRYRLNSEGRLPRRSAVKIERGFVLHCFQKKSKRGIKTPKHEVDLDQKTPENGEEPGGNYEQEDSI